MPSSSASTLLESRLDWLSCSANTPTSAASLWQSAEEWIEVETAGGERLREYRSRGYQGYIAGRIRLARTNESTILALSGELAQVYGEPCAVLADHWSRADYCCTVQYGSGSRAVAKLAYQQALRARNVRGARAHVGLIQSTPGGDTMTIGRRTSAAYARLYDKTSESGGTYPEHCWRYEVELKRHRSEAEQKRWRISRPDSAEVVAIVADRFHRAGVVTPLESPLAAPVIRAPGHKRDAETVYHWLQAQVGPSARWLASVAGIDAVIGALAIADLVERQRNDGG